MKPNDLDYPFNWEERRPLLSDQVLWVPEFYPKYQDLTFPGWEAPEVFGNANPVHVEYCSGNGSWLIENAMKHPEINWVAIEKRFDRVRKIWAKAKNRKLKNILVICGEGVCATREYFPEHSVAQAYVNFPDPWPKDRHAKHRIIQQPFVEQMARVLKPNAELFLVTDDVTYCQQMVEEMTAHSGFEPCYPDPHYVTELGDYGTSFFEDLWRSKGKSIHYQRYRSLGPAGVSLCSF